MKINYCTCDYCGQLNHLEDLYCQFCGGRLRLEDSSPKISTGIPRSLHMVEQTPYGVILTWNDGVVEKKHPIPTLRQIIERTT